MLFYFIEQMVSIEQLYNWSHGTWLAFHESTEIKDLIIDSRKVNNPGQALFIAIETVRRNGHNYIESAYEKGIRNFLVHEPVDVNKYPASNFYW